MRQFFIIFLLSLGLSGQEIHVKSNSLNGNGTISSPFNLEQGIKALNEKNGQLIIHPGDYEILNTLSITCANSTITAFRGAKFIGGVSVSAIQKPSNGFSKRLRPEVINKVIQIDLKSLKLKSINPWPAKFSDRGGILDLIYDGARLPIARWPNEGTATMKRVIDMGSTDRKNYRGGTFEFDSDRHLKWPIKEGVWLKGYWRVPWVIECLKIKQLDGVKKTITFEQPVAMGIGSKYHRPNGSGKEPYWVENQIEEIDLPGEWAIDFKSSTLLLYPPKNMDLSKLKIADSKGPLFLFKNCNNLRVEGLNIEGGLEDSIQILGGKKVIIDKCKARATGAYAVSIKDGFEHEVKNSHFYNLGAGGVKVAAGNREKLIPSKHQILSNHIHDYGQIQRVYAGAVNLNFSHGSVGVRVANNLIHHSPHVGILLSGNDNIIEYNEIHNVCLFSNDMGGIYSWYDWTSRGNIIRYNYIHSSPQAHGVYWDDGDSGDIAYGNVIRGVDAGVFVGGGHDNIAKRNLIIDCKTGIHIDARGISRNYTAKNRRLAGMLTKFKVNQSPWKDRYPLLPGILDNHPELPTGCKFIDNKIINCKHLLSKKASKEQLSQVTFSGNSEVKSEEMTSLILQKKIPQELNLNIPFHKIGLNK